MAQLNPYLAFSGNCREAMTFYQGCFGGELTMQTMGESPMGEQTPAEAKDHIMHSQLTKGGLVIMASDMGGAEEPAQGSAVTLSLSCSSEEEIQTLFSKLAAGGQVTHPLQVEFWGATFGTLTDKFGMNWMLNYDKNMQA